MDFIYHINELVTNSKKSIVKNKIFEITRYNKLLLDINNGKKSINDIDNIFKSENRINAGICASPVGLYLNKIYFDKRY